MIPKEIKALYYFFLIHENEHGVKMDYLMNYPEVFDYVLKVTLYSSSSYVFDPKKLRLRAIDTILKDLGI